MEEFDFIQDEKFKAILERDFKELEQLIQHKITKSTLVIGGSLIETLLMEFLYNKPPQGYTPSKVMDLSLADLISLAEHEKLISKRSKDLSTVIRDYRNLIHPGRELRKKDVFDFENANVAFSLVKMIIKEVRENYIFLYGYNAKDVLSKLENDDNTVSILPQLVDKLSTSERIRLINLLINYDGYIGSRHAIIDFLLDKVPEDFLNTKLKEMLKIFELESQERAIDLFKTFGRHINKLKDEEIETIIMYMLGYLNAEVELSKLSTFYNDKSLMYVTKNLKSKVSKELFLITILDYYLFQNNNATIKNIYKVLMSGLETEKIDEVENLLEERSKKALRNYRSRFNDDDLPF